MNALLDIVIEHQYYCQENGMFCQFMDGRSGYCIATNCKRMTNLLEQTEIERRAEWEQEKADNMIFLKDEKEKDIERNQIQHEKRKQN